MSEEFVMEVSQNCSPPERADFCLVAYPSLVEGHVLCCGGWFWNCVNQCWQSTVDLPKYATKKQRQALYVAFVPQSCGRFFAKFGYYTFKKRCSNCSDSELINYIEKKSPLLRITDEVGAGVFVLPIPTSHVGFVNPAIAAEASLKAKLFGSADLHCTQTNETDSDIGWNYSWDNWKVEVVFVSVICLQLNLSCEFGSELRI